MKLPFQINNFTVTVEWSTSVKTMFQDARSIHCCLKCETWQHWQKRIWRTVRGKANTLLLFDIILRVFGPSDQEQPSGNNGWGAVAFDLRSMRLSGHKCATARVCKPQSFWGGCLSSNISSTVRISVYPCSIKLKMVKSEAAWLVMCVEWNTFKDLQDLTEILRKWQWPSCQPRRVCLI